MSSTKTYTAINVQHPISQLILKGDKTIETRKYPLPEKYKGIEMILMETPGKNGNFISRIAGIIVFTDCFEYKSKKDFYADTSKHCVTKDSVWAWKDGKKFGWKVKVVKQFKQPKSFTGNKGIIYTQNVNAP